MEGRMKKRKRKDRMDKKKEVKKTREVSDEIPLCVPHNEARPVKSVSFHSPFFSLPPNSWVSLFCLLPLCVSSPSSSSVFSPSQLTSLLISFLFHFSASEFLGFRILPSSTPCVVSLPVLSSLLLNLSPSLSPFFLRFSSFLHALAENTKLLTERSSGKSQLQKRKKRYIQLQKQQKDTSIKLILHGKCHKNTSKFAKPMTVYYYTRKKTTPSKQKTGQKTLQKIIPASNIYMIKK